MKSIIYRKFRYVFYRIKLEAEKLITMAFRITRGRWEQTGAHINTPSGSGAGKQLLLCIPIKGK